MRLVACKGLFAESSSMPTAFKCGGPRIVSWGWWVGLKGWLTRKGKGWKASKQWKLLTLYKCNNNNFIKPQRLFIIHPRIRSWVFH